MPDFSNFLQNKYTKWYLDIISSARSRTMSGYTEQHHVIPKSLGGNYKRWHNDNCKVIKGELKFQD